MVGLYLEQHVLLLRDGEDLENGDLTVSRSSRSKATYTVELHRLRNIPHPEEYDSTQLEQAQK